MLCGLSCNVFSRENTISPGFSGFCEEYAWNEVAQRASWTRYPPTINMKSKKNLTRFTYENAAFEGWRLCISRGGTTFTKYFPDKKFGGGRKSLLAAESALVDIKAILESGKRINGKLSPATIRKAGALLAKL